MIVDLPSTTTAKIAKKLIALREDGGVVSLGRVLTLVVTTDDAHAEAAIAEANDASREHPCRILVLAAGERRGSDRLDGQVRIGGDAGASEVIVLRTYGALSDHGASIVLPLLLPDTPVVAWWPAGAPERPSTDPVGMLAQRRVTDSAAGADPLGTLARLGRSHSPGDTDFAWSRLTSWRALLATALDTDPRGEVARARVVGEPDNPSVALMAAWLSWALGTEVEQVESPAGSGLSEVVLTRPSGDVVLRRPHGSVATLSQPGQPERRMALPRRSMTECLSEELRRLDPDDVYGEVLTSGIALFERAATAVGPSSGPAHEEA